MNDMEKKLVTMKLSEIVPYKNNPRKNKSAVKAVSDSIRAVGYNNPIIVDENKVILAGHTRRLSLIQRGDEEAQVLQVSGMSEAAKRKFRLLDNKVGEYASWDYVSLAEELAALDFSGMDFDWGIDWKSAMFDEDESENGKKKKEKPEYICPSCGFHFKA